LILAPSRGAADDFLRVFSGGEELGTAGVHRFTLTQLAAQLALSQLEPGDRPASRLALEALTARTLEELRRDNLIPYFQPVADTPGLARAVTSTLLELRLNQVRPAEVDSTGAPGKDLAGILKRFEEESGEHLDLADVLTRATQTRRHPLLGLPVLWLCCEIPSLSHALLAKHVLSQAPHVLAVAPSGDVPNLRALEAILNVEPQEVTLESPLEQIAGSLFALEIERPAASGHVRFFSAAGEGLECVEIARNIRKLIDQESLHFDQIAVLLRSAERYQPLMEEALRRAGIPAYFTRGVARPDPAGRAFLALLACAQEQCSATRFAEYLSLGQTPAFSGATRGQGPLPVPDDELLASFVAASAAAATALEPGMEEDAEAAFVSAPFAWEKLLVDAAVVGGRSRWQRRLRGLETELRFKLASLNREDSSRAAQVERQIEQLRSLSAFALPLIAQLDLLPVEARWGEWLNELEQLAVAALKRPESVISALEELRAMEDVGPVDLAEVYGVLSERMRFLRREPARSRYGKVFVASIGEVRGRSFRAVFLPGLAEGLFPRRAVEDPILLDTYRARIANPMVDQAERVRQERMLLHMAVGAAEEHLIYSYPRMDVMQNRPRVPSFYALELLRATRGKLPDLRMFEHEAAENAPTRLDWPAPHRCEDAIDEAEFDLAKVRGAEPGGAFYLTRVNPILLRSMRARAGRWRRKWFPSDGLVVDTPDSLVTAALAKHGLRERAYSPSSLQMYAACPYKFLLHAVHRLEKREEPEGIEQLDPLTRGEIFHAMQFRLMQELAAAKALPVTRENRGAALDAADRVLHAVAEKYFDDLAPAIPRVWQNEIDDLKTDLRAWLIDVSERSTEWTPIHFELSFGLQAGEERDKSSSLDPVVLEDAGIVRGSIDLVERHNTTGLLRITDHKTGSFPQKPPIYTGGGSMLQPVLYGMAASKLLRTPVQAGRLYYCTRKGDYKDVQIRLTPEAENNLKIVLHTIDEAIATGFLPAAPKADACEYCDYRIVCGPYEVERTSRKRRERVQSLLDLRELP
jgi:ATP-dependent helicase/nuclease subunit B